MSNFKIIFISVFAAAAVFGILVFSGIINIGGSSSTAGQSGSVTIWGTLPTAPMQKVVADFD